MTSIPQRWVGVAYAVLAVLLFSSFTLTSRAGFTTGLRPPDIAALRFGIGGLLLAPVLIRNGLRSLRPEMRSQSPSCSGSHRNLKSNGCPVPLRCGGKLLRLLRPRAAHRA